ncbi:family 43 glycosylhydrolase [Flammeovirga yaeyamensis]|uniref:Family 43 glycosylhydrolase n=1 Tax=Flammeovirga yaeyamensis TaxID=367791 RepID=A0AAX1NDM0_9BACT|nr:T9SS type A sorting domain-containing protein [Flammeovirga yaeyamensis]MBB3699194.1 hypothetical protein [Flammeovirga yaeyamensis]NMF35542.1 family 43 glycosylhydrolase [Flammeovirga yaeyamensis]QWG04400.1 family 43 glycosylhydrolase [Flammeovirga yaeyamensis]
MKLLPLLFLTFLMCNITYAQNKKTASTKSSATLRLEQYAQNGNCDVNIPNNPEWNIAFNRYDLQGDLAPNNYYTRRDPSSVIKVEGKYYVWYSYSLTDAPGKEAPWDYNDLYYATSTDGWTWEEQGLAVGRGPEGSFDHRSAFTTEIFYHEKKFYLVYQAAKDLEGIYDKNTIAMAYADSPDGPWTKVPEPLVAPTTDADGPFFDDNAVHDPCILHFNNKFYLYYKGEGSEEPICGVGVWGLNKQVKWGVAIADNPTGPYVKSPQNPITNTGHEVCVWNSENGVALMLHQDGPEYGTVQYAEDGVNFEIKGKVNDFVLQDYSSDYPEAAGLYRPVTDDKSPVTGVSWGICHTLTRSGGKFWMYLRRFESKDKSIIVDDSDNEGIVLTDEIPEQPVEPEEPEPEPEEPSEPEVPGDGETPTSVGKTSSSLLNVYPNPVDQSLYLEGIIAGIYDFEIRSIVGQIVKQNQFDTDNKMINVSNLTSGLYFLSLMNHTTNDFYKSSFLKN